VELPLDLLDYELPPERIAQFPVEPRDSARLLVVERGNPSLQDRHVRDLPELLRPGDLLVLNNTRVLPARLYGQRETTGGKWEGLFVGQVPDGGWELLCQTRGSPQLGESFVVGEGQLRLRLERKTAEGSWLMRPDRDEPAVTLLERFGHVPLPPYIRGGKDEPGDSERYQTVFAQQPGSVAAPTAGLHFTEQLFQGLRERGIERAFVTLHVGIGTFKPIQHQDVAKHVMHAEMGELNPATADAILACKRRGGRVIAVGTTSVRVLESAAADGQAMTWHGATRLFIYPPYRFRCVDGLMTNFHLPRSSLLALVGALLGLPRLMEVYRHAIEREYRFYSYGDAMLIL
jgi:S-adenosylmethionine:tRNA ribosyltransferase-isomerase